jgi:hypothetical protein
MHGPWCAAYRKRTIRIGVAGPATLEIRLRARLQSIGLLGPERSSDHVLVSIDDPTAFTAAARQ